MEEDPIPETYTVAGDFMSCGLRGVDLMQDGTVLALCFQAMEDPTRAIRVLLIQQDAQQALSGLEEFVRQMRLALGASAAPASDTLN